MRGVASSIAITTAEHDVRRLAAAADTLVVLMAHARLQATAAALAGVLGPGRPAAMIAAATLPEQRVAIGTLADIAERSMRAGLKSPATLVVGEVVAQAAADKGSLVDLVRFG
jgi:siroheme synthase